MAFSVAKRRSIYIYIYITLKFLALQGAPYIHDISRLRVKINTILDITLIFLDNFTASYYMTRLLLGQSKNWGLICGTGRDFVLGSIHTGSETHPASC
jgi:hypothetical protein